MERREITFYHVSFKKQGGKFKKCVEYIRILLKKVFLL